MKITPIIPRRSVYGKRLIKLIRHLERGKLGHKVFDFSTWDYGPKVNHCRTNGCAAGELPVIFPKLWHFVPDKWAGDRVSDPRLIKGSGNDTWQTFNDLAKFFNVRKDDIIEMFTFTDDNRLRSTARRQTVAKHLRKFLK
jgi:hypothetical protein